MDRPAFNKVIERMEQNGTFKVEERQADFLFRELGMYSLEEVQYAAGELLKTYTYNRLPQLANWHQAIIEKRRAPKYSMEIHGEGYPCNKCGRSGHTGFVYFHPPGGDPVAVLCGCLNAPGWAFEELKNRRTWSVKLLLDEGKATIRDFTDFRGNPLFDIPNGI